MHVCNNSCIYVWMHASVYHLYISKLQATISKTGLGGRSPPPPVRPNGPSAFHTSSWPFPPKNGGPLAFQSFPPTFQQASMLQQSILTPRKLSARQACARLQYVCMHVCMFVCIHVCMYACMYLCMYIHLYIYIYIYI